MDVEEKRVNKKYYKLVLQYLKIIPMLIAFCDILNTASYFMGYDIEVFSFVGGISFLTLAFLYLVPYVFRFCIYHRMFLHYVLINNTLETIEYVFVLPISDCAYIILWSIFTGIFLFLVLVFRKKILCYI